jgi:hypothetical protein
MIGAHLRQCGNKKIYPDMDTAKKAASELGKKSHVSVRFDAYRCPWCDKYHIGRQRTLSQVVRRQERLGSHMERKVTQKHRGVGRREILAEELEAEARKMEREVWLVPEDDDDEWREMFPELDDE